MSPTQPLHVSLNLSLSLPGMGMAQPQLPFDHSSPPWLRVWTPDAPPLPSPTPPGDTRTVNPGVTRGDPVVSPDLPPPEPPKVQRRWVLRSVYTLLLWRPKRYELAPASWYDYRTLVSRWEEYWTKHHGRPDRGPDVREITDAHLREFFESQTRWKSSRTWTKYRDLFCSILRCGLVRSESNRGGPRAEDALLTELPWMDVPPERWFKERAKKCAGPDRVGGHRPSRDTLLTVEEFDRVIEATQMATFPKWDGCDAQAFWRAFFALSWTYGPRLRNLLCLPWSAIDWDRCSLQFEESKKGNEVWVPLAPAVLNALQEIRRGERTWILPIPTGQRANLERNFYPTYKLIWQWAGVPLRMPHHLRATCISRWKEHAPEWRKFATGHSRAGDIQDQHYVIVGEKFRQAVLSYPQPRALLG